MKYANNREKAVGKKMEQRADLLRGHYVRMGG